MRFVFNDPKNIKNIYSGQKDMILFLFFEPVLFTLANNSRFVLKKTRFKVNKKKNSKSYQT